MKNLNLKKQTIYFALAVLLIFSFMAVFANWIAPYSVQEGDLSKRLLEPTSEHLLGCDLNGLDILSSIIYGARTSLFIGLVTVLLSLTIGTFIGLLSGYFGGVFDNIIMRIIDMLMAFPALLVAMILASTLGQSPWTIILAISATGWISAARLIRGEVLKYKELSYVKASQALGANHWRIMWKHILPSTVTSMVVHATFSLSGVIIIESGLSFLGLGTLEGFPSWGALLSQGQSVIMQAPHLSIVPGVAIMLLVLSLNFLGDGLRDFMDTKSTF